MLSDTTWHEFTGKCQDSHSGKGVGGEIFKAFPNWTISVKLIGFPLQKGNVPKNLMRKWDNDMMIVSEKCLRLPLKLFAHLCSIIKCVCVCDSDPARSRLTWVIDNIILECSLLTIARHKQHKKIAWKHPTRSTRWQFMGSTRWLQSTHFDWASFRLPLFCLLSCHVYYTYI